MKKYSSYITYDGTEFKNIKEGLEYDKRIIREISNDLWFIKLNSDEDGFDKIKPIDYEVVYFIHTSDYYHLIKNFGDCPIIYCRTRKAAEVLTKFLNIDNPYKIKGLSLGLNFWFEETFSYKHLIDFEHYYGGEAKEALDKMLNTIDTFIVNNLKED